MPYLNRIRMCQSFQRLAYWVMKRIDESHSFSLSFSEETITESLLLKLAKKHHQGLDIKSFSKYQEGSKKIRATGADWEFWVEEKGRGIRIRVQAKRQFKSGKYESLDGNGNQIKTLLQNCGKAIPIYVFYNGSIFLRFKSSRNRLMYCDASHYKGALFGCTFAPVFAIPKKNRPTPKDIHPMWPWHLLVCDCMLSDTSLPDQLSSVLKALYENPSSNLEEIKEINFTPSDAAPEWVRHLNDDDSNATVLTQYLNKNKLQAVVLVSVKTFPPNLL